MTDWFKHLTELQQGLIATGSVVVAWLLLVELPSKDVLGLAPWPSTTRTIRDAIAWWHPLALLIALFLFVLTTHFDNGWRVRYLIAVAALIVAAVLFHYFVPKA